MTNREIIAEYILQGIKQGSLVTIYLKGTEVVNGYILDADVFTVNPAEELRDAITRHTTGSSAVRKSNITIDELKLPNEKEEQVKDALYLNFSLLPKPKRTIRVEDIAAIKKIEEEE